MDANAVSAAPRRNAPCPCGSGKRYKDCHGALVAPSDRPARDIAMRQRMEAAAAAQRAGSYAEAIALYESVLATSPRTFGAVHMLGVATTSAASSRGHTSSCDQHSRSCPPMQARDTTCD